MERFWIMSHVAAWVVVAAQVGTVFLLFWALGRIYLRRAPDAHALISDEGPDIHEPLPTMDMRDSATGLLLQSSDYTGRTWVLLLVSAGCAPCESLMHDIKSTYHGLRRSLRPEKFVVVVESASDEENRTGAAWTREYKHRLSDEHVQLILDSGAVLRTQLGVKRTPYGFLMDAEGIVRMKGVVNDRGQLEGLIARRGRPMGTLVWQAEP